MDSENKIAIALNRKIKQLEHFYKQEKNHSLDLKGKIMNLEEQIGSLEIEIKTLKKTIEKLNVALAFRAKGDTSDVKNIIDELVREINECVTLLNR
jgi:chromosome segregation ATPase